MLILWHAFLFVGLTGLGMWVCFLLVPFCLVFFTAFLVTTYSNVMISLWVYRNDVWVPISATLCRRAVLMLWHAFLFLGLSGFPLFSSFCLVA
jgi:hypothetical protein